MHDILHRNINDFFRPISNPDLEKKVWFRILKVLHGVFIVTAIGIAILISIIFNDFASGFFTALFTLVILRVLARLIIYIVVGSSRNIN